MDSRLRPSPSRHPLPFPLLAALALPAVLALAGCGSNSGCPKFQSLMQLAACPAGQPVDLPSHYSSVFRGRIMAGGVPVAGANVTVEVFDWGVRKSAVSDSQGVFQLEELRPETYRVVVCRPGYRPALGFAFIGEKYKELPMMVDLKPDAPAR